MKETKETDKTVTIDSHAAVQVGSDQFAIHLVGYSFYYSYFHLLLLHFHQLLNHRLYIRTLTRIDGTYHLRSPEQQFPPNEQLWLQVGSHRWLCFDVS